MRSLFVCLLAAACGSSELTSPPDGGMALDDVKLGPAPGWPATVAARSLPATFRTSVTGMEVAPTGKVWILRDRMIAADDFFGTPVLERYAADGPLEKSVTFPADARVSSFVIHPSGELSVFVLRDSDGKKQFYDLQILRLSPDGDIVGDSRLEEMPGPRENLFYQSAVDVQELPQKKLQLSWRNRAMGVADGDGLFLVVEWTYGTKVYRLDGADRVAWGAQVMPAYLGAAFIFFPSVLASDASTVYVAILVFQDDLPIYGVHFDRPALAPVGSFDTVVQGFDAASGAFAGVKVFGGPGVDQPIAMMAKDGTLTIVGAERLKKHDDANRTLEWDLTVDRGTLASSQPQEVFDLSRDDFALSAASAPDGSLVIGGRTDYVQVDTNSEVENGKGLFLSLAPDLETRSELDLVGPRDVQVHAVRFAPDGTLVFAGTRGGPLTHTPPPETTNDAVWGVVR